MKLVSTAFLLTLSVLLPASSPSPLAQDSSFQSPNDQPVRRVASVFNAHTCTASWIQSAESRASKSYRQTISTLCSSLQSKYKTVTHSVYTTTTTPKTSLDTTSTASRPIATVTRTVEVTRQSTDTEVSTSVTVVTAENDVTSVVATDIVTVTVPAGGIVVPRKLYPCQSIESLLSLPANSATPFCSCYETGTTSTTTVTCKGASTAAAVRVTDHVTVTPSRSTTVKTVDQTTTAVVTEESKITVTSTVTADETIPVTNTITATVTAIAPIATSGKIQVMNAPYLGYRVDYNGPNRPFFKLVQEPNQGADFRLDPDDHYLSTYVEDDPAFDYNSEVVYASQEADPADGITLQELAKDGYVYPTWTITPAGYLAAKEASGDRRMYLEACVGLDYISLNLESDATKCQQVELAFVTAI